MGGVVAQGAEGVGPMGGVREGELLQVGEGEEWVHILRGEGTGEEEKEGEGRRRERGKGRGEGGGEEEWEWRSGSGGVGGERGDERAACYSSEHATCKHNCRIFQEIDLLQLRKGTELVKVMRRVHKSLGVNQRCTYVRTYMYGSG